MDINSSLLAGLSTAQLTQALADAQQAYLDLSTGQKGESFTYTQGDGSKSVTFTRANLAQLTSLIRQLQFQLGIISRARRPISFLYR